ncbi:MAG: hypothetical protein L6R40_000703 [Gallowayella cf. fulva]|nr:MAG: hypothetical protein L6R40_000703 [Xanthomendoza cf. fulva]
MTSIPQPVLPPQASNNASHTAGQPQSSSTSHSGRTPPQPAGTAPPQARSYASATKKQSSPASATYTSTSSSVPAGASGPAQHVKAESVSAVNGRLPITPAVPAVGGAPTIVNGNTSSTPSSGPVDHGRKASITITPAGTSGYLPNGDQVGAKPAGGNSIKWGTLNADGSPALANAIPQPPQSTNALAVNPPSNPRVTSPSASPSPIPQPPASGGRPPSTFPGQNNGMSFGSMPTGDDPNRQMRPGMHQSNLGPGPQSAHLRRESSQSGHSEYGNPGMGPNANRGGYPQQGGRGRGGYNGQYPQQQQQQQQQMSYSQAPSFRAPSQPRGAPNAPSPYTSRASLAAPYANSPHQASRSPALSQSQPVQHQHQHHPQPGQMPMSSSSYMGYGGYAPTMGQSQVKPQSSSSSSHHPPPFTQKDFLFPTLDKPSAVHPLDLAPNTGHFEQFLTEIKQNQHVMPQYGFDPQYTAAYYHQQAMYGAVPPYMQSIAPNSPRPQQQIPQGSQQQYVQGQYGYPSQPPSMSRTSSAISGVERPPSSMSKSQTPMPNPAASNTPISGRPTNSPAPKSASSFKIPAKKSAGIVIRDPNSGAVKSFDKKSPSPAPPTQSPAIVSSTPTPPPPPTSTTDAQHIRSESKSVKSNEEKRNDMKDAIAKKLEEERAAEKRKKDEDEARAAAEKSETEAKLLKEKEEAEARELEAAKAQMEAEEAASKAKAEADEAEKAAQKAKAEAEEQARKDREEEEELARFEAEMERKEREAEEKYQKKKKAEAEEKARKEAEAAKSLDEDMKRAEKEAEEAEEVRLKKLAEGEEDTSQKENKDLFAALKKGGATTPSSDSQAVGETPVDSGAQTPASEASMAPPKTVNSKQKPAALKLETTKTVEPPQPSAQLLSLRSARRLTSLNDVSYPAAIASPNPALNTTAPMGKFRYDKNFLVQFQSVFVEKPSEDWSNKIKETLGAADEPASARTGSARPGGSMGSRAPSKTGPSMPPMGGISGTMGGGMGSFNARPSAPVGKDSKSRFEASTQQLQGGQRSMQNPFAQFYPAGRPGVPPMGGASKMERIPSVTSIGGSHPHSPRGNSSQRGSTRGASKGGRTRENDKDAKAMPLTVGTALKPIETTDKGWKPLSVGANAFGMAGPAPGGDGHMAPDVVQRKVKSNLNKMTPNNFNKISDQVLAIAAQSKDETDGRTLRQVIQLTFEKATDEAHWAEMYAQFCKRMLESMSPEIKDESILDKKTGEVSTGGALFRKYLLTRCQTEFEQGWKVNLPDKPEGESEEAVMLSDEYYKAAAAKRRGLGLVRFIGELYKLNMLTERIMHECVKKLVDYEGMPDEAEVESLTSLLKTIGANLESSKQGHQLMDAYFVRIQNMIDTPGLASRLRFMLMDIGDLRRNKWVSTKAGVLKGPATLEQVRAESAEADRQKELQRQADAGARRGGGGGGGGGGRAQMGRGDARQFSGGSQFGMMQPPPDRNLVGMDDLRRLGRGGSRQPSSTNTTVLGPPGAMFGPRSSSNRKPLGAAGFGKPGEDSGASSRTGTPPAQKEKKEREEKEAAAKNANAFSALEGLDNAGEPADPTSPPSAASTPRASKLSLAQRQRSKSPLGQKDDKPEDEAS